MELKKRVWLTTGSSTKTGRHGPARLVQRSRGKLVVARLPFFPPVALTFIRSQGIQLGCTPHVELSYVTVELRTDASRERRR